MEAATETAVEKACRLAGGQSELARKVSELDGKITPQAVWKWVNSGRVPPDKAPIVEQITKVSVEDLCPDFPWPRRRKSRAA